MVRRSVFIAGMVLVLGSLAVTASAQPGGGRGGMGNLFGNLLGGGAGGTVTNVMLLRMPEVQTELALTDDQKNQVADLISESTQAIRDAMGQINFQDLMNATPDEQQKFRDDMQKKITDASKGVDGKVGTILNATQTKRLQELVRQRAGAAALILPENVTALGLSTEQVTKIKGIIAAPVTGFTMPAYDPDQTQEQRQAAMQEAMKKVQDQAAKTLKDSLAVLTDDQSITWANMLGKTFKFPANQFGGRGGFGGGRGAGGGGGGGGG